MRLGGNNILRISETTYFGHKRPRIIPDSTSTIGSLNQSGLNRETVARYHGPRILVTMMNDPWGSVEPLAYTMSELAVKKMGLSTDDESGESGLAAHPVTDWLMENPCFCANSLPPGNKRSLNICQTLPTHFLTIHSLNRPSNLFKGHTRPAHTDPPLQRFVGTFSQFSTGVIDRGEEECL